MLAFMAVMGIVLFRLRPHVWNSTASMPIGLYRVLPLKRPVTTLRAGTIVIVCFGSRALQHAHQLGIRLTSDACDGDGQTALKRLWGTGCARMTSGGLILNGRHVPHSTPQAGIRWATPQCSHGSRAWVGTPEATSYDSRYLGPLRVIGLADRGF